MTSKNINMEAFSCIKCLLILSIVLFCGDGALGEVVALNDNNIDGILGEYWVVFDFVSQC